MCPYAMGIFHYKIQPYDNIWQLAQRFNSSVQGIMAANPGIDPDNLLVGQVIRIPIPINPAIPSCTGNCMSKPEAEFRSVMRLLWQQHISWARMAMVSLAYDLPDAEYVAARLLQNSVDMGNMLRPLYGDYIANQYTALIKEHLVLAMELVEAGIAGDEQGAEAIEKAWYASADQIVEFLSSINPYLPKEEFRKMFYMHLALTQKEALAVINKNFKQDIATFDDIAMDAMAMADMLSDAIMKQYAGLYR